MEEKSSNSAIIALALLIGSAAIIAESFYLNNSEEELEVQMPFAQTVPITNGNGRDDHSFVPTYDDVLATEASGLSETEKRGTYKHAEKGKTCSRCV